MKDYEFENLLLEKKISALDNLLKKSQKGNRRLKRENILCKKELLELKSKNKELKEDLSRLRGILNTKMKKLADMYDSLQCVREREKNLKKELKKFKSNAFMTNEDVEFDEYYDLVVSRLRELGETKKPDRGTVYDDYESAMDHFDCAESFYAEWNN
jgi:chromosome segregation ATPase